MEHLIKDTDYLNGIICFVMPCQSTFWEHKLGKINCSQCLGTPMQNHCKLHLKAFRLSEVWRSGFEILLNSMNWRIEVFTEYSNDQCHYSLIPFVILASINEMASLEFPLFCWRTVDVKLNCSPWELVTLYFCCSEKIWRKCRPHKHDSFSY